VVGVSRFPRIKSGGYRHFAPSGQKNDNFHATLSTYFNIDTTDIADPGSHYTRQVVDLAIRLVAEDGSPYRDACWRLWRDHRVFVPFATIQNWVEAAGEKNVL